MSIEERIAKHERLATIAQGKMNEYTLKIAALTTRRDNHKNTAEKLKAKLAKQQAKDQATGKALVESGAITEEQKEMIKKLPLPEEKAN